jgi:hypothetical protein
MDFKQLWRLELLAAVLPFYVVTALIASWCLNHEIGSSLEPLLSILVAPLLVIFIPLYPLLRILGLMEGEWIRGPSFMGIAVGTLVYTIAIFALLHVLTNHWIKK